MQIRDEAEITCLLVKAGRLRRVAGANSMVRYRSMILRVARELEARAAALQGELERQSGSQKNIFAHPRAVH
jgi:hypothetical protein